jgi:hypothetical protein
MAIDFPASPTLNDVFTVGTVTYVWDGTKWTASVTGGISLDKIEEGNTSAEVIDTGSDGRFVVTTEGTERLFVNASGQVGVGTAVPGSFNSAANQLVIGTGSGNQGATLYAGSTGESSLFFADSVGGSQGQIFYRHSNDSFGFVTNNGSAALNITSAGLVGIGTSSPATALQVAGAIRSSGTGAYLPTAAGTNWATTAAFIAQGSYGGGASFVDGSAGFSAWAQSSGSILNLGYGSVGGSLTAGFTFTNTGRLGIGTTSPKRLLHIHGGSGSTKIQLTNTFTGSSTDGDGFQLSLSSDGTANIEQRENADLTFSTNNTEAARIDSSRRLLVGTSTSLAAASQLQIEGTSYYGGGASLRRNSNDAGATALRICKSRGTSNGSYSIVAQNDNLGLIQFSGADGNTDEVGAEILCQVDGTPGNGDMPGRLVFSTTADGASSPTERMRITRGGDLFSLNADNGIVSRSTLPAGTANTIFAGQHSATSIISGTNCFRVYTNGNVQNTNNSYGALSDIKLKENIVDANSQWDDLKALQVRNYNFKEGQTHTQIGLVAQEVELVSPGLVTESPDRDEDGNDLGTVTKSVNYSVLYMKAVKALQEAIAKIETLEGMVAVNNITIDEQQHQLSTLAARLTALESA